MAEQNMRNEWTSPQIHQLIDMQNDGTLTPEEVAPFRFQRQTGLGAQDDTDWAGLGEYANSTKGTSIDLREQNMYDATAENRNPPTSMTAAITAATGTLPVM